MEFRVQMSFLLLKEKLLLFLVAFTHTFYRHKTYNVLTETPLTRS